MDLTIKSDASSVIKTVILYIQTAFTPKPSHMRFLSFPPAICPATSDNTSNGIAARPKPEKILNKNTNGTGICTAIIHCFENLVALLLK